MMKLLSLICILINMHRTYAQTCDGAKYFPNSCVDILKSGMDTNDIYQIAGANGETWSVYCDFTTEPGSAWTLVMSWSLENKDTPAFTSKSFSEDAPLNGMTPNWTIYRMSKEQMSFLKTKSTHWRATCSFEQIEIDYRDYMRGKFEDTDITTLVSSWGCHNVEYINILGNVGTGTVAFLQNYQNFLHTHSSQNICDFISTGLGNDDDMFGWYGNTNPDFRCTASPTATTQYWFGSYQ